MANRYDVIVIGAGLGGLVSAGLLARAGRKVLVIERNPSVGGAASTYAAGDLAVEASLHETSDPHDPGDPKHGTLASLGVLDAVEWVPVGSLYQARGGIIGAPFVMPDNFAAARAALADRFPAAQAGTGALLDEIERIGNGLATVMRAREAFRNPLNGLAGLTNLWPAIRDWRLSLGAVFQDRLGSDEAAKTALAANLGYFHDDPDTMWWVFFAIAQGGYLRSGGRYIRGGSQRLSDALAAALQAAGGEIVSGRTARAIRLNGAGGVRAVCHDDGKDRGGETEVEAPVVVGNAAPAVLARMLPEDVRARFLSRYAELTPSISLFSLTLGLSARPAELGVTSYSTFILPKWMKTLAHYRENAPLLQGAPGTRMPAVMMVDYSQIDSGLGGPPYTVAVVAPDRLANWAGLDRAAYDDKRHLWQEAIIGAIDREFPGFASRVVASQFHTARSIAEHLNAPEGAVYGFAPTPPSIPLWRGIERSPRTTVPGLYLASAYAGSGGFTGSIIGAAGAAGLIGTRSQTS